MCQLKLSHAVRDPCGLHPEEPSGKTVLVDPARVELEVRKPSKPFNCRSDGWVPIRLTVEFRIV